MIPERQPGCLQGPNEDRFIESIGFAGMLPSACRPCAVPLLHRLSVTVDIGSTALIRFGSGGFVQFDWIFADNTQ